MKAKKQTLPSYILTWRNANKKHYHTPYFYDKDFEKFINRKEIKLLNPALD